MDRTINVGSNYREWWFVGLVGVTACLLLAGALLWFAGNDWAVAALVAGAGCGFASCLAAASIASRKAAVQITPDGLIFRDRKGEREFTDEQVICASLHFKPHFTNGERKSDTRTFDLWYETDSGSERVKLVNRIPAGDADPLELLIERIHGHLFDRAEAALAARQPFEGEDWTLHAEELIVMRNRKVTSVRLDELAASDVYDNEICVWKQGEDEPSARVPIRSANACVLLKMLHVRLAEAPRAEPAPAGDPLGRILFERKPRPATMLALWCLPLPGIALFIGCLAAAFARQQFDLALGAVFGLVLAAVGAIPLLQCAEFRCHEYGVTRRWLRREKRLKFSDVESFTYSAVRQYVKGVYSGTTFTLTFASTAGGKAEKIAYSKTLRNADEELDHLRDRISQVIASRMAAEFSLGRSVAWTDGLRFLQEGLEYRASGLLGRKAPVLLPYDEIEGIGIHDGVFRLWIAGARKPVVKENVAQANFYPGFQFLGRLLATQGRTALAQVG